MTREQTIKRIKEEEGFRALAYKCTANKWTIGYGRNLEDKGLSLNEQIMIFGSSTSKSDVISYFKGNKITEKMAEKLLNNDVNEVLISLDRNIDKLNEYPNEVISVLIDMTFNMGINGLMKFKKFLGALKDGNWEQASKEMLDSKWAVQVGNRAKILSKIILNIKP